MRLYIPEKIGKTLKIRDREEIFIVTNSENVSNFILTRQKPYGEKILHCANIVQTHRDYGDTYNDFFSLSIPNKIKLSKMPIFLKYPRKEDVEEALCLEVKTSKR